MTPLTYAYFAVPHCEACAAGFSSYRRRRVVASALSIAAAASIGLVPLVLDAPFYPTLAAVAVIGAALSAVLHILVRRRPRPGAATSSPAVFVQSTSINGIVLQVANEDWAEELARLNQRTKERVGVWGALLRSWLPLATAGTASAVAAVVYLVSFGGTHTTVIVDNASSEPLDIWVDDIRRGTVDGWANDRIRVRRGARKLAAARRGAPAEPGFEVILSEPVVLFNPGKTTCYWREVSIYGSERQLSDTQLPAWSVAREMDGPLPRRELYQLPNIDSWLKENPREVELDSTTATATRTTILPNPVCADLARRGCPSHVLDQLIACQRRRDVEPSACAQAAERLCPRATAL